MDDAKGGSTGGGGGEETDVDAALMCVMAGTSASISTPSRSKWTLADSASSHSVVVAGDRCRRVETRGGSPRRKNSLMKSSAVKSLASFDTGEEMEGGLGPHLLTSDQIADPLSNIAAAGRDEGLLHGGIRVLVPE